jgi:hypothetical protein
MIAPQTCRLESISVSASMTARKSTCFEKWRRIVMHKPVQRCTGDRRRTRRRGRRLDELESVSRQDEWTSIQCKLRRQVTASEWKVSSAFGFLHAILGSAELPFPKRVAPEASNNASAQVADGHRGAYSGESNLRLRGETAPARFDSHSKSSLHYDHAKPQRPKGRERESGVG